MRNALNDVLKKEFEVFKELEEAFEEFKELKEGC